jgi:hypothetical protein
MNTYELELSGSEFQFLHMVWNNLWIDDLSKLENEGHRERALDILTKLQAISDTNEKF